MKQITSTTRWHTFRKKLITKLVFKNCFYCGVHTNEKHLDPRQISIDHVIPVSKGGEAFDIDNMIIACRKCNVSRRDKDFEEFFAETKSLGVV